jgi:ribose-phosphate pyrophosphokinase
LLYAFPEEHVPARRLANALQIELVLFQSHVFPDGEVLPRASVTAPTIHLYRSLNRPNEKLVELLLAADALRRLGATRLVLVAPYLAYMRQDIAFHPGEPSSQQVVADLLDRAFDRLVTVDPHLHRTHSLSGLFQRCKATQVHAADALVPFLQSTHVSGDTVVAGPDEESSPWVQRIAEPLGLASLVLTKRRTGDKDVSITLPPTADISSKPVLLTDDICSTGSTLSAAAGALRSAGCGPVTVFVTHALCSEATLQELRAAGIERFISTDACIHPTNAVQLASLLASELQDEIAL